MRFIGSLQRVFYITKEKPFHNWNGFFILSLFWELGKLELIPYSYLNNSVILVIFGISILNQIG